MHSNRGKEEMYKALISLPIIDSNEKRIFSICVVNSILTSIMKITLILTSELGLNAAWMEK
jgi:hypothetical protein